VTALEKNPALLATVSKEGKVIAAEKTKFSEDLSGVAYDSELDLLWVLSDSNEQ